MFIFLQKKLRNQTGASMVETLFAMVVMLLIFFGLVQIIVWASGKMICEYAAFQVARGRSMGYTNNIIMKAGRVAAMGASGRDISEQPLRTGATLDEVGSRAEDYMRYESFGNYGVNYEFWDGSESGELVISSQADADSVRGSVAIRHQKLLTPGIKYLVSGATQADIPAGESVVRNYAAEYINE